MPTVIDALLVTLALDGTKFEKGRKQVNEALDKTKAKGNDTAKALSDSGKKGAEVFSKMRTEALAFLAVFTAGKGLKAFISDTIDSSAAAGRLATNLGISTRSLTTLQAAAQGVGATAGEVGSSLQSVVSAFQTIDGRVNLGKVFGQLRVGLTDAQGHLRDLAGPGMSRDLAAAAQRLGPQMFSALMGQAGYSQGLINFYEQGAAKVGQQLAAQAPFAASGRDADAAQRLLQDLNLLEHQSGSFGREILTDLTPNIHEVLSAMSGWIDKNQAWLTQDVEGAVRKIGTAVENINWNQVAQDVTTIEGDIRDVTTAVGGWKDALEAVFALWTGLKFLSVLANARALGAAVGATAAGGALGAAGAAGAGVAFAAQRGAGAIPGSAWGLLMAASRLATLDDSVKQDLARHQGPLRADQRARVASEDIADWMAKGWTRAQADVIEGNLAQESGLNPYDINPKSGAFGLAQWLGSRVADFKRVMGTDLIYSTRKQQRDFIQWELTHSKKASGDLLRGITSEDAAAVFGRSFEGYGPNEEGHRTAYARQYAQLDLSGSRAGGTVVNNSSESHMHGDVHVHTNATDPKAVAKETAKALQARRTLAAQSNVGLQV